MRIAAFVIVLAIHAVLFFLFAALHSPSRQLSEPEALTTLVFMSEPKTEMIQPGEAVPKPPAARAAAPVAARTVAPVASRAPPVMARAARAAAPRVPATVSPAPKTESEPASSSITPAPDWRAEAQIAANDEIEAEARKRERPSPLAPHDFSGVTPGSTDTRKPKFGWYGARTHRVEGTPGSALVVHINDRCAVAILFIFPFPVCKIGKMPARGDLLEHMTDVPAAGDSKLP